MHYLQIYQLISVIHFRLRKTTKLEIKAVQTKPGQLFFRVKEIHGKSYFSNNTFVEKICHYLNFIHFFQIIFELNYLSNIVTTFQRPLVPLLQKTANMAKHI